MTQPDDFEVDPTQDPARTPHPDPAVDPEQDPALGPAREGALDPAQDPAEQHPVAESDPVQDQDQDQDHDQDQDQELAEAVETSEDEYARPADDGPGEQSIDDALETDRVAAEGADSRNTDGFRFDATRDRGLEDVAAADQGNRDEDRMVGEGDDVDELDELAGTGADAAGTDRDLADPDSVGAGESGQLTDPEPGPGDLV